MRCLVTNAGELCCQVFEIKSAAEFLRQLSQRVFGGKWLLISTSMHARATLKDFRKSKGFFAQNCMKMKESGVLRHFPFQEFLKFQELSHPCWVPQFFLDTCIRKENSCQDVCLFELAKGSYL